MSQWFFAANGQQQGPYPEDQFRNLIASGAVRADTLVWTEGMTGWQRAADVPGLMASAGRRPSLPQAGAPPMMAGGGSGGSLSIDLPLLPFLGRILLAFVGFLLVIPAPWVYTSLYRWLASRTKVPGRPGFAFTGQPLDIWYVFIAMALLNFAGIFDHWLQLVATVVSAFLSWIMTRWIAGNLSSNGQHLPIAFNGGVWPFIGWQLLIYISFITIIGWAWVVTAWMRWNCRNISGTRREIVFNASGLEVLWRTIVLVIACAFIIPIPWMLRWYNQWFVSQFALVPRGTLASA
jgi:GYF domain 2